MGKRIAMLGAGAIGSSVGADLTAAGHDVNEVAQLLFLTPGTVRAVLESTGEGTA